MAGIFESLKRMVQGKPMFDANDQNTGWADKTGKAIKAQPSTEAPRQSGPQPVRSVQTGVVKGSPNTFPVVYVKRTRTHVSGDNMDVYCGIMNSSNGPIELEEIHLAGYSRSLGGELRAGQEREYLVYSGRRPSHDIHEQAYLNYKDDTGDYFQSIHDVKYQYLADKTYLVEDLHLRMPIRDIYG